MRYHSWPEPHVFSQVTLAFKWLSLNHSWMTLKYAWGNATLVTSPFLPPTSILSKSEEEEALSLPMCRKDPLKISLTDWTVWYVGRAPSYTALHAMPIMPTCFTPKASTSLISSSSSQPSESSQVLALESDSKTVKPHAPLLASKL